MFPCFICEWDVHDKAQQSVKTECPKRQSPTQGNKDLIRSSGAVDRKKVLLLPLPIWLGVMKQFVKAIPKDGGCFKYL
ncbi:hypothetical protein TNCV_1945141 [Trichonephila clavipes]|nr:hypothetical protein TNCV_1945141 [Trichonephila clavipes]